MKIIILSLIVLSFSSFGKCKNYWSSQKNENYQKYSRKSISIKNAARKITNPKFRAELSVNNNDCGNIAWFQTRVLNGLLEMYLLEGDEKYLRRFIKKAEAIIKVNDAVTLKKDKLRNRIVYGWSSTKYTALGDRHVHGVQSGIIAETFANFSSLIRFKRLRKYKDEADRYLSIAYTTILSIEEDWDERLGFYRFRSKAHNKYRIYPYNQGLAIGSAYLEIAKSFKMRGNYDIYKNLLRKAELIGKYFLKTIRLDRQNERYLWRYAPDAFYEDSSHAQIDLNFAMKAYESGILFSYENMQKFANTVLHNFNDSGTKFYRYINGSNLPSYTSWHSLTCMPLMDFSKFLSRNKSKELVSKCIKATSAIINNENVLKLLPYQYYVHLVDGLPKLLKNYQFINQRR